MGLRHGRARGRPAGWRHFSYGDWTLGEGGVKGVSDGHSTTAALSTFRICPSGLGSSRASWEMAQWTRGHVGVGCWLRASGWALSLSFLLWEGTH